MQLEAVDQTHISSMAAYDDGLPFVQPGLPVNTPLALPVHDASRRLMAQAYSIIRQKYEKGQGLVAALPMLMVWGKESFERGDNNCLHAAQAGRQP